MSINDLIHTNAHNAFEQGVKTEQERIIKLLIEIGIFCDGHWRHECIDIENCNLKINGGWHGKSPCELDFMGGNDCKRAIALIKGMQNANN